MRNGYILIDGNNMAHRALHGHDIDMKTSTGIPTTVIYGVLSQLAYVRQVYHGFMPLVVWDAGYDERTRISKEAQSKGLVPAGYKENRHKDPHDPKKVMLNSQVPKVQEILSLTNMPQIRIAGEEADDVIASYCRKLSASGKKVICFTCDHDYYQLVSADTTIIARNRGNDMPMTLEKFTEKYGIQPYQWVDVGALQGDNGDNIFGVPGIGESTAIDLVREHGSYGAVIDACVAPLKAHRIEYPDLSTQEQVDELIGTRSDKKINPFEGCYPGMPFSGVALALEQGKLKKIKRTTLYIAMYQDRVRTAYILKKMRSELDVPELKPFDRFKLEAFNAICDKYELMAIRRQVHLFVDLTDELLCAGATT